MTEQTFDLEYVNRPLVYIAGPYANPDPVANTHSTIRAVDGFVDDGLVTPIVPHLTLLWHLITPRPAEFWYAYDLATLSRCDALFRLHGASTGADNEVAFAESLGIPVFFTVEQLYAWTHTREEK